MVIANRKMQFLITCFDLPFRGFRGGILGGTIRQGGKYHFQLDLYNEFAPGANHTRNQLKNAGAIGKESITMEIATHRKQFAITCSDLVFSSKEL